MLPYSGTSPCCTIGTDIAHARLRESFVEVTLPQTVQYWTAVPYGLLLWRAIWISDCCEWAAKPSPTTAARVKVTEK